MKPLQITILAFAITFYALAQPKFAQVTGPARDCSVR